MRRRTQKSETCGGLASIRRRTQKFFFFFFFFFFLLVFSLPIPSPFVPVTQTTQKYSYDRLEWYFCFKAIETYIFSTIVFTVSPMTMDAVRCLEKLVFILSLSGMMHEKSGLVTGKNVKEFLHACATICMGAFTPIDEGNSHRNSKILLVMFKMKPTRKFKVPQFFSFDFQKECVIWWRLKKKCANPSNTRVFIKVLSWDVLVHGRVKGGLKPRANVTSTG